MTEHEKIARAFSGHRFEEAYAGLADEVRWTLVGSGLIVGKEGVVTACEQTRDGLVDTTTDFSRFLVTVGEASVAVDTVSTYTDATGGVTAVASCDIYEFEGDRCVAITSYTVDVTERMPD